MLVTSLITAHSYDVHVCPVCSVGSFLGGHPQGLAQLLGPVLSALPWEQIQLAQVMPFPRSPVITAAIFACYLYLPSCCSTLHRQLTLTYTSMAISHDMRELVNTQAGCPPTPCDKHNLHQVYNQLTRRDCCLDHTETYGDRVNDALFCMCRADPSRLQWVCGPESYCGSSEHNRSGAGLCLSGLPNLLGNQCQGCRDSHADHAGMQLQMCMRVLTDAV